MDVKLDGKLKIMEAVVVLGTFCSCVEWGLCSLTLQTRINLSTIFVCGCLCLPSTSGTAKARETFTSYRKSEEICCRDPEGFALQLAGRRQKELLQSGLQQVCSLCVEILALLLQFLQVPNLVLDALNLLLC